MSSFPLYDIVSNNIIQNQIKEAVDKVKLIKCINNSLDQDGRNKIYALIKYYSVNKDYIDAKIPFEGVLEYDSIIFDIDKLPNDLVIILSEFSKMHIQHMKDLQKIEKIRKKNNNK